MDQSISDAQTYFKSKAKCSPLKELLKQNEKNYDVQLQVAKYFKKSDTYEKKPVIQLVSNENDDMAIFFIYGDRIDSSKKQDYDSFKIHLIETMHPHIDQYFSIVFFNTNQMTASVLSDFKDFYATLPEKYFLQMQKFIVVHANFIVKSGGIFGMNEIRTFFKKITLFVDNLLQLSREQWFRYKILSIIPDSIKSFDQSHKDIENIRKKTVVRKLQTKQAVGDQELDEDNNFDRNSKILGQPLESYELNRFGIPCIIDLLVQYFEKQPDKIKAEGIFRKQAALYEEKILEAALACQKVGFINKVENPQTVACVFKQFFLQLKEPLIPYHLYEWAIENKQQIEQTMDLSVQMLFDSLPALNRDILYFVLGFLNKVSSYKEDNLMTTYNLAVVFGPNFFRSEVLKMSDLTNINFFVQLVQVMIEKKKDFDYTKYLEMRNENYNFDASLVPFLPEDAANLDDILDMVTDKNVVNETERKELKSKYI